MFIVLLLLLFCCCCCRCCRLLSQAFPSWYFSWTNGDSHCPCFKFHTAVLSVLCVMLLVQLSFVVNMLNVSSVWLPNISLNLLLLFRWLQNITGIILHLRFHILCISIHKLLYFSFFSASFCITYSVHGYCHIYQYSCFLSLFFVIITGLFSLTLLSVFTAFCHNTVTSYLYTVVWPFVYVCVCVCARAIIIIIIIIIHLDALRWQMPSTVLPIYSVGVRSLLKIG